MTYLVMDNHVYGMTKGQPSPTTEPDWETKLAPHGTGLRVFHPLVIALAAGANFVARAFSGDPNGTADIIADAIRTPGFSFVEILSPCVTFRPEQRDWRKIVRPAPVAPTDDAVLASRRLLSDDGFNIGVLYRGTARSACRRSARPAGACRPEKGSALWRCRERSDLMAHAYAMELEASERYSEFADVTHNNREVSDLFAKLAKIEQLHAGRS
jgi:hypothetical protein